MGQGITDRQQEILRFIRETTAARGIPPTLREIGKQFGIASTNGVDKHLRALENAGVLSRERGKSRGIAVAGSRMAVSTVPLLGRVAAGVPVLSPENREGDLAVDPSLFALKPQQQIFALAVRGESMIEAHILDGDTVLVREQSTARNGEIVVALVDGEATVKRFFQEGGRIRLQPENRNMRPIVIEQGDLRILGRVVGVLRRM